MTEYKAKGEVSGDRDISPTLTTKNPALIGHNVKGALSWEFCCFPQKPTQKCNLMTFTNTETFLEMQEKDID